MSAPGIGEIVPGVLYVGTEDQAADADTLRQIGLSHVMYLSDRSMSAHPDLVAYKHVCVAAPQTDAMDLEVVPTLPMSVKWNNLSHVHSSNQTMSSKVMMKVP